LGLAIWYLTPVSDHVVELLLTRVPIEADLELGRQAVKEVQYKTIYHPRWTPLMQSIGWELVSSSKEVTTSNYQWDFAVLQDAQMVNAFALPGGVIRVSSGLLEQLQLTDGELAALLGHEMGHVLHRHSQARILQNQLLTTILQALVYQDDDPYQESFGEAIGELMVKSADWFGQQSFSRRNEYEADATSWELLLSSRRYHPQALQALLTKLWEYNGKSGGTTSWESTHPGTLDRIGALDEKWKALPFQERRKLTQSTVL
jgi:predicted Zn-dependent protease